MAVDWPWSALEAIPGSVWSYYTGQDAKPAGGAKMGEALKDEIERLRKLVKEAYEEGYVTGRTARAGHPEEWWETSNVRKALDNAP